MNCKKNPLKKLYYEFNIRPNKYPSKLTHLTFGDSFNKSVDNLPNLLTHLTFGKSFNKSVDNLPNSLTHLTFGKSFNQTVDNLPNSITYLKFGSDGKWGGSCFYYPLDNLPNSIKCLEFSKNSKFNKTLMNLPNSLTTLILSGYYPISINNLPDTIENLNLNCNEDFYIGDGAGPPKCCKEKIYKLPKNIKNINIIIMNEAIQLDFSDLNKLHQEINNVSYSW